MILVTGGTGFIGSHCYKSSPHSVSRTRVLARPRRLAPRFPAGVEPVPAISSAARASSDALRGVDTVIHLAGVTKALHARRLLCRQRAGHRNSGARAAGALGIRLVHVSSLAAIGPSEGNAPVEEDAAPHPLTHYGKSKLEAERVVRDSDSGRRDRAAARGLRPARHRCLSSC